MADNKILNDHELESVSGGVVMGDPYHGQFVGRTTNYTVVRGDTLSAIARRFGTTVSVLAEINSIRNPDKIYVGQVLIIPNS